MIKAVDEWTTVYGGPGSSINDSFIFPMGLHLFRSEKRKEKIKKIFKL